MYNPQQFLINTQHFTGKEQIHLMLSELLPGLDNIFHLNML
jgi:hypothetical protein